MSNAITDYYKIGNFAFEVSYDSRIEFPIMFRKFRIQNTAAEYHYFIHVVDSLPVQQGTIVTGRDDIIISKTDVGENRYLGTRSGDFHAYYEEIGNGQANIYLLENYLSWLEIDPFFTSLFALERRMMERNSLILHCAYMRYQDTAILFSAPSGTGKSTQADLWEKYRGSTIINGDRALLSFADDRLTANGWPVCGSSGICENISTPVKCIVMLSQAEENGIQVLRPRDAFVQLYSQITINTWSREYVNQTMNLIEKIIAAVPVYHLGCTISEEAVRCLENELEM